MQKTDEGKMVEVARPVRGYSRGPVPDYPSPPARQQEAGESTLAPTSSLKKSSTYQHQGLLLKGVGVLVRP